VFEVLQKISEEPLAVCIDCGYKLEKLVSSTAFQFKGSGWYVTDYKSQNPKKEEAPNSAT
jgi:putative FmdB family regulatory protein